MSDDERTSATPSHYVAIGASAGGLEAIESFFTRLSGPSGAAFIVIQHLSPDYKSLMVEILSKKTEMPVHRAEEGMLVLPDHVYLIPPKKNLSIFHGKLLLTEQDHSRGINLPIDFFLKALAEDQSEKAVGIILSGTGSDGTRGVRAVKENGGMVMVQDEESARFNGMPRAAAATGLADFILPPEEMPRQLLSYLKMPYTAKAARSETLLSDEDGLARIFAILRERCKVDFSYYKPSTVTRRIERRMAITQCDSLTEYVASLQTYPGEATTLFRELLIGVTSFFRDQAAFDLIAQDVLPDMLRAAGGKELRFWVAGCSTGEEAYSLAILVRECAENLGLAPDVKIFATDIDSDAVRFAAAGVYPESVAADLAPSYLAKYFVRRDESVQVTRALREMVVFAQHNLIKDPPFTNIQLVSCRNLLIYLQPVLQRKVLDYFNFSLAPGGVLFLGTSETTGDAADFFETIDSKLKIYRSKGRVRQPEPILGAPMVTDTRVRESRDRFIGERRAWRGVDEERMLERFIETLGPDILPLSVIVNEQLEVLHTSGDSGDYFRIPSGKLSADITKLAVKELAIPLATGIQKCFRERRDVRLSGIRLRHGAQVDLVVRMLSQKKGQENLVAVLVNPARRREEIEGDQAITFDMAGEAEQRIKDLEQELQFSRENLQATIEELETSNEELQATNEELLASNEELQSTNEELQSTNEELFTVNAEYHKKIIELTELHNDVDNLLTASHIGKLILDENLEVRRFSPTITSIFRLLDSDIGRPITHIQHDLLDLDPASLVREVQATNVTIAREVRTQDDRWFFMRIIPYAVGPGAFSGTVLSFTDIAEVKAAERMRLAAEGERQAAERESQATRWRFDAVANASPALFWMSGPDKGRSWFSKSWLDFTGRSAVEEGGEGWSKAVHPEDRQHCVEIYTKAFDAGLTYSMEYRLRRFDGEYRWLLEQGKPLLDGIAGAGVGGGVGAGGAGAVTGYIGSCLDITEHRNAQQRLNELEASLAAMEAGRAGGNGAGGNGGKREVHP